MWDLPFAEAHSEFNDQGVLVTDSRGHLYAMGVGIPLFISIFCVYQLVRYALFR